MKDYTQCISLCDILIKKQYARTENDADTRYFQENNTQTAEESHITSESSKKRCHQISSDENTEMLEGRSIRAYVYKTEALYKNGQIKEGLKTIDK